jgi:hypothetical protein
VRSSQSLHGRSTSGLPSIDARVDGEVARERAKLLIPPGTPDLLTAAIESYWRTWPEQRDKVLARYEAELQQLRAAGLDVDSGDPDALWPIAVEIERQNVARGHATALLSSTFFFDDRYGGPLGFALLGEDWEDKEPRLHSMLEVATRDELCEVAEASHDELRRRPPVRVCVRSDVGELGAGIIGETNGVALRDFSRLPAARDLVGLSEDGPIVARRSAYRRFANEFWALLGPDARGARSTAVPIQHTQTTLPTLLGMPVQVAIDAMLVADKETAWKGLRTSRPPTYGDPKGFQVTVGEPVSQLTTEQQRRAVEIVLVLDDESALTFLFAMGRYLAHLDEPDRKTRKVRVHVNEALEFRGRERHRKGDFRPEQKREERDRFLRLSQLWVAGKDVVKEQRRNRKTGELMLRRKTVNVYSRLLEVAIETEADAEGAPIPLLTEIPEATTPYAFRVQPGDWADAYVGNARYLGPLFSKIGRYDPAQGVERVAVRLALFLTFTWSASHGAIEGSWSVGELLHGAKLDKPTHHPDRFRSAFEAALDKLRDDVIIAGWQYGAGDEEALPLRGWLAEWLRFTVLVRAPRQVVARADRLQRIAPTPPSRCP